MKQKYNEALALLYGNSDYAPNTAIAMMEECAKEDDPEALLQLGYIYRSGMVMLGNGYACLEKSAECFEKVIDHFNNKTMQAEEVSLCNEARVQLSKVKLLMEYVARLPQPTAKVETTPQHEGAQCNCCDRYMLETDGCDCFPMTLNGIEYQPIKVGDPGDWMEGESDDARCPDCNAKMGHYHHPGCDNERCPKCGGQLISCDCFE